VPMPADDHGDDQEDIMQALPDDEEDDELEQGPGTGTGVREMLVHWVGSTE
jgi:hypothetical protein